MLRITKVAMLAGLFAAAQPAWAQPAAPRPEGRGMGALFDRIDIDRDGRVTVTEAWKFAETRFATADADRDGSLTQAEMAAMMAEGRRGPGRDRPEQARAGGPDGDFSAVMFRVIDVNRDQKVTLDELRPAVEARFRSLDANLDNAVTKDEIPAGHHGRGPGGAPQARPPG